MHDSPARILIVEDESDIRRFVRLTLESDGHEVFEADGAKRGLIEAGTRRPDLAIFDLGLPDGDGVDLIKDLRHWSTMPVIVLSARSTEAEKIEALDAGADDFLVKPFGSGELLARVRAQLRRQAQPNAASEPLIEFGDMAIDLLKRNVTKQGQTLHLTPIEYRLLTYLVSQRDCVITHSQLVKSVWGPNHMEDKHYVRVHMANLRKKIEDNPSHPKHLLTEAGVGYRFKCN
jgi:two-component system KDP operon response regulator KdpE